MSYTMYTPLNVWLDPASVTDVVAYIQTYLSENTIYSETEIETIIHDYLIAHPELIGGVQSVNGKTGTVVLSASDINTANNVTIESVLSSLSSQISSIAASVATNTSNITSLTGRVTTAETDISNLKSNITESTFEQSKNICPNPTASTNGGGYLNRASGSFGAVEQGKTYTFSATNITNVGKALSLRLIRNGAWVNQVDAYATENARFSATFTATDDSELYLNAYFGQDFDPVFNNIMLELGSSASEYVPYGPVETLTANDKIARAEIDNIKEELDLEYVLNKIYVSTTGDDSTGDGSETNPFKTIFHAYETISDNSETNRYIVEVADGTYTDLQTKYSGITGAAYQGVVSKNYVSVESVSGNPDNCILQWDGSTGFDTFNEADSNYKCFFHLNDNAVGVKISGIKFIGSNLRYCLHIETNKKQDVLIENCVFDWAGCVFADTTLKNRPVVGMGGSYYQNVTFKKCKFYNSQNTAGVQWHDNVPYVMSCYPSGAVLRFEDCFFDGLNIQVRSYNYDRSNTVFSLELVRCAGLNIVYPTIASGTVNYWRYTNDSNRIADDRMADCTDTTTVAEQTALK